MWYMYQHVIDFCHQHEPLVEIMSKEQMFVQLLLEPSRELSLCLLKVSLYLVAIGVTPGQHCGWALCLATLFKRWHFLPGDIAAEILGVSSRGFNFCRIHSELLSGDCQQ